jgi:hypothetical protein
LGTCSGGASTNSTQQQQQQSQQHQQHPIVGSSEGSTAPAHPLLLELAQQMHLQATAAAAVAAGMPQPDGSLLDVPSAADHLQSLQQQVQQLQELAAKNSSKPAALAAAAAADAAAAAATAAGPSAGAVLGSASMDQGSSGSSNGSNSMLWSAKYAPVLVQQLCGNKVAAAAFHAFLSDWKSLIQQHAAAVAAGKRQAGGGGAAAAESDAETESSWLQSLLSGWGSSACDEPAATGR